MSPHAAHLAQLLHDATLEVPDAAVHPSFRVYIEHARHTGLGYISSSRSDHAPLSDLRLRRDVSARDLLYLNVEVLAETAPALKAEIVAFAKREGTDHVLTGLRARMNPVGLGDGSPPSHEPADPRDSAEVFASMARYVNVFGSWDDAEAIAANVIAVLPSMQNDEHRWSIAGYAGVVLGLSAHEGYAGLLESAMENQPDPIESFFTGLRWASIEAKRRSDLQLAGRIIDRAQELANLSTLGERDLRIICGMSNNFRGLLSIRAKDSSSAERFVESAIDQFGENPGQTDRVVPDEATRYAWMARLNQAQMAMYDGRDEAEALLSNLVEFARDQDHGALHTSLSALGYVRLQAGRPGDAIPLLLESLDLLRVEYDLNVVRQVRKMLYRAFVEVGADLSAETVRQDDDYYWRTASHGEKYGYIN